MGDAPNVTVQVVVNVGRLRAGQQFDTPLTPRIAELAAIGYARILGHVGAIPVAPQPAPDEEGADDGGVADRH